MEQLFFFEVTYKNYLLGNKKAATPKDCCIGKISLFTLVT